ncbi:S-layer homology domain-containing protein [Pseudoflavonifractor phocaeensis]|uniref:S-layer homology domain-containing protein n=1 Tax=Pseudoflavonifractor phocaeensis TaxID=1870988 RepID=UPI00195936C2|nr:S-layer homology domain-containing protein [Pseudoflavonifractor phocaeensis]MBM6871473.1 S-layer homology domain-containing protein [Pseudoflavonifractor phocaeensis]
MRNLKRVLSMALASVMVLGMMVVGASAADFSDQAEIKNTTAADVMTAIDVLEGTDKGQFLPNEILTREQAAKIICYMLMGPENAEKLGNSGTMFTDVAADRWSAPYISYCANMGILAGDGTGKFLPEGQLTGHAFAKMLLVALGYDATIQNYTGTAWAINVATDAVNAGIFVNGTVLSDPLSRDNAAQMAFQTLTADMVKYSNKGTTITINGIEVATGASAPEAVTVDKDEKGYDDKADGVQQFCEKYFSDLKKVVNDTDDLGRPAATWYYGNVSDDNKVATSAETADYTVVIDENVTSTDVLAKLKDETGNKKLTAGSVYALNGETDQAVMDLKTGDVVEIFLGDDNAIEAAVVSRYSLEQITNVDTDVDDDDAEDGVVAYVTIDGTEYNSTDIAGFNADTYEEDAYVAVIVNDGKVIASYIPEAVEGSVSTKNVSKNTLTVDGTKYTVVDGYSAGVLDTTLANVTVGKDSSYILYLDNNDYVLGIELVEGADATIDDVYYVALVWKNEGTGSYGGKDTTYHAQLVAMDGTVSEIELESRDLANKDTVIENQAGKVGTDPYTNADYAGKLVTISDKKWTGTAYNEGQSTGGSTTTTTYKAGNEKYDLTVWDGGKDWDIKDANTGSTTFEFTKNTTRMTVGKTYRFNSSTEYVMIGESGSDLAVSTATGGISLNTTASDKVYFITADGSSTVKYVIIGSASEIDQKTEYNEDLVFVADADKNEVGDGYVMQTLYFVDGSSKTVAVAEDYTADTAGFYAYTINDDDYYELDDADVDTMDIKVASSKYIWDGEEGVLVNAKMEANALYDGLLTVTTTDSHKYEDIDVSGAKFVDAHDKDADGQYEKSVSSLKALADLLDADAPKVENVKLALNVSEDGAVVVILTSIEAVAD